MDDTYATALYILSVAYHAVGDLVSLEKVTQGAINNQLEPLNEFYNSLGIAYILQQKDSDAPDAFTKAKDLNPRSFWSLLNRFQVLARSGNSEAAMADLSEMSKYPVPMDYQEQARGFVSQGMGDYEKALKHFENALQANGKRIDYMFNVALMQLVLGNVSAADNHIQKGIRLSKISTMHALIETITEYRIILQKKPEVLEIKNAMERISKRIEVLKRNIR